MKHRVLVSAPYLQSAIEQYRSALDAAGLDLVIPEVRERLSEAELLTLIGDIDGVLAGDDRFTARVFEAAGRLKVISKWGTGIDSIDMEAARRRQIAVRSTPGAFNEPLAEQVLGYMLCFARRIPWITDDMRGGAWRKRPAVSLSNCTLGVIGVGNTGKAVVRRAKAFGMRLLGNDIVEMPPEFLAETGIRMVDKDSLVCESDFISLNCDLNPTSHHIISRRELALMKPSGVLINCARGALVDEPALIAALRSGRPAGAGLDVFEEEPLPQESPLRSLPNVLLSPHNANSSPEHWKRIHEVTIRNLLQELESHVESARRSEECTP